MLYFDFQNSHAISDVGLSITKRLAQKEEDLQGVTALVSLPSVLYKPYEKKEGDETMVSYILSEVGILSFHRISLCNVGSLFWHLCAGNLSDR